MNPESVSSPPVLVFDCTDPTGAGGLQGAVLTLAALGCLPLSVATAVVCGDTRAVEQVYPLDPEWIAEQARPVLEDVPVAGILVGDPGCADSVAVIAEIAADYPAPLVFAPGHLRDQPDPDDGDDLIAASLELLLPQTTMLVVDGTVAMRMVAVGDEEPGADAPDEAARVLLRCGAETLLLGDGRDAAMQAADRLIGPQGVLRTDLRPVSSRHVQGSLAALAAATAAGLARGLDCIQAVGAAQAYLKPALESALHPGMGAAQLDRIAPLRRSAP